MSERKTTSAGRAVYDRNVLEREYEPVIQEQFKIFLLAFQSFALSSPLPVTQADAASLWAARVEELRTSGKVPPEVADWMAESDIPYVAAEAVQGAQFAADEERASDRRRAILIGVVLGLIAVDAALLASLPAALAAVPQMNWGVITTPIAGAHSSWVSRAKMFARTAATRKESQSVLDELRADGFPYKRWSTRFDDRVRPTHVHADRQTVLLDDVFQVGNEMLQYPGDPNGSWAEIASCRCVLIGVRFAPGGVEPNWNWPA